MQQIKLFKSVESEMEALEKDVNIWIAQNKVKVISIVGNISPQTQQPGSMGSFSVSDILILVTYEASNG